MILASIKPYYYYLIAEEKKKIEVRKMALKNLPQDIAFYMSKDEKSFAKIPKEFQEKYRKHFGKIGMRVVCDEVEEFHEWELSPQGKFADFERERLENFLTAACLSEEEVVRYRENLPYFKPLYGWHISDLKIYDKPKELSEFSKPCPIDTRNCENCITFGKPYTWDFDEKTEKIFCTRRLTRPPQSYMFVEEVEQ